MEYISAPTINKIELNDKNKQRISAAINSYVQLSFWAMYHDERVIFHGDPHSGNLCIDENGGLCFLDMGLLGVLNAEDTQLCRKFFLAAYTKNSEKLYNLLISYGDMNDQQKRNFREDCRNFCLNVQDKEVTYYFTDMINICFNYNFVPPNFLFSMAKTFICLNGIGNFANNKHTAVEILQAQTFEFMLRRSLKDCRDVVKDGLSAIPDMIGQTIDDGWIRGISSAFAHKKSLTVLMDDFQEMLDLLRQLA